jgi:hypothetical protein
MNGMVVFMIAGILIILAAVLAVSHYREKERTERLQTVAAEMGYSFLPEADSSLHGTLGHFHLFSQGHSRKAHNVLRGRAGDVEVTIFDYRYRTSSGKHQDIKHQTVLLFESERLHLPHFTLRPENLFHKLGSSLGYQDIDFDAYPAFSDRYLLQGPDEGAIREAFDDEVLSYYSRYGDLCTEGARQQLIFYRPRKRLDPVMIHSFLDEGLKALDLFVAEEDILGGLDLFVEEEEEDILDGLEALGIELPELEPDDV